MLKRRSAATPLFALLLCIALINIPKVNAELTHDDYDWSYTHVDYNNIDVGVGSWNIVNASQQLGVNVSGGVIEITTQNRDYTGDYSAGVRTRGSSLVRRLAMDASQDSLQRCKTQLTWYTPVGTGAYAGMIETWEGHTDINIEIVGYFLNVSYTEMFQYMTTDVNDAWTEINVASLYGVPANSVLMTFCGTAGSDAGQLVGVRSTNQSYNRYFSMSGKSDANGQHNLMTLPVQVDANGAIEYYVDDYTSNNTRIYLQGYFGAGEMYFNEHWVDLNPASSGAWETHDLTVYAPDSNSTVYIVHGNDYGLADWEIQETDNIGSPSRYGADYIRGSADSGHYQPKSMCVDIDQNDQFNSWHTAHASQVMYYAGYFFDYNPVAEDAGDWGQYFYHGYFFGGIGFMMLGVILTFQFMKNRDLDTFTRLAWGFISFIVGVGLVYLYANI